MPELISLLHAHDFSFLRVVADLWAVPASGADKRAFALSLAEFLPDPAVFAEFYEGLPEHATEALKALKQAGGQMPWARFARTYGDLRPMGQGKRNREQPWHFPVCTAETLYYRALIGREFIRVDDELLETVYVPEEFIPLLPDVPAKEVTAIQNSLNPCKAPPADKQNDAGLHLVDNFCTLFAALRLGDAQKRLEKSPKPWSYWQTLQSLGDALGLLDAHDLPGDLARALLERSRSESLAWLAHNWANARNFNELFLLPGFRCEGSWRNRPLPTRRKLLDLLLALPADNWYKLADFIAFVEENEPDFLRQGADYELWMIYSEFSGTLLRGTDSWQALEPYFIEDFITRWMYWLGLTRIYHDPSGETYFALTARAEYLDGMMPSTDNSAQDEPLIVQSDGKILMTDKTAPIARYQVARFAEWLELGPNQYSFQLTPASLAKATQSGLSTRHLLSLLRKYGKSAPPPTLLKALNRWQEHGAEASIETLTILRLKSPETLQALKDSDANMWLGESLSPVAVIVKPGGVEKVQQALARLGYLSDFEIQGPKK